MNRILFLLILMISVSCAPSAPKPEKWQKGGMTLEAPFQMEAVEQVGPWDILPVEEQSSHVYKEPENGRIFVVNYSRYNPSVEQADHQGAVDGAVGGMKGHPQTKEFSREDRSIDYGDVACTETTGKWTAGNETVTYRMRIYTRGRELWQILTVWPPDDREFPETVNKVIGSVRFGPEN